MVGGSIAPDRSDATPLYIQLANNLRHAIKEGAVKVGGALPSERMLTEQTGASRVTIRKAILQLVEEGLLLRRQGSGTYLAPRFEQAGDELSGFTADMRLRGALPGSIWLMKAISKPTSEEAQVLCIAAMTDVARLGRVRLANGEPLAIEHAVVPARFLPPLKKIRHSLYEALEAHGYRPTHGEQRIQASLATPTEAALLSVEVGSALLRIERIARLADGTPIELTRSAYRGDRYDFVTDLSQCAEH